MASYPVINYTAIEMITLSWEMLKKEWEDEVFLESQHTTQQKHFFTDFLMDLKLRNQLGSQDASIILFMTLLFSIYRGLLTNFVVKPITSYFHFGQRETDKFKESACKLSCFGVFFSLSYYLMNFKYPFLQTDLATQWDGFYQTMPVPFDIKILFYIEAGYYFHATYAAYYLDVWKKDSVAMMIHHVLANSLIIFSFALRYHRIGLVVMYLHDGADIILDITKLIMCFKQKLKWPIFTYLSNIGFVLFSSNWFWCRLVVYPQIVLFSSFYVARSMFCGSVASFYFTFNFMLSFLLCLNVFWFHFIILLFIRIATGKTKEVEDVREYDLDITSNDKYLNGAVPLNRSSNGHYKNGNVKMKMCGEGEEKVQDGSVSRLNGVADKHRKEN